MPMHLSARAAAGLTGSPRRPKYGNRRTVVDGITFDSAKEAKRYQELRLLEKAGAIRNLTRQPWFVLAAPVMPDGLRDYNAGEVTGRDIVGHYRADFSYDECDHASGHRGWRFVVEDVKGHKTELYRWKYRHMKVQYGVTIREV